MPAVTVTETDAQDNLTSVEALAAEWAGAVNRAVGFAVKGIISNFVSRLLILWLNLRHALLCPVGPEQRLRRVPT